MFGQLQWMQDPPKQRHFSGVYHQNTSAPKYSVHRECETWAYRGVMEIKPQGGGRLKVRDYNGTVVSQASFLDMPEGTTLFEQLKAEIIRMTTEWEAKLVA